MRWRCSSCDTLNEGATACMVCGSSTGSGPPVDASDAPAVDDQTRLGASPPAAPSRSQAPPIASAPPPSGGQGDGHAHTGLGGPADPTIALPGGTGAEDPVDPSKGGRGRPGYLLPLLAVMVLTAILIGLLLAVVTGRQSSSEPAVSREVTAEAGTKRARDAAPSDVDEIPATTTTSEPAEVITTTAPTTMTTPITAPPPRDEAEELLRQIADEDRHRVRQLDGFWLPQIGSKKVGVAHEGILYGPEEILEDYRSRQRPDYDVLLLWTNDVSSFGLADHWVVVVDAPFTNHIDALWWCEERGFSDDDCFTKRIVFGGAPEGTAKYRAELGPPGARER